MKLKSKTIKTIFIGIFIMIVLFIFFVWQNNTLVITDHEYINSKLPKGFDGYKIVHISDLHNKDFHQRITEKIEAIHPDMIVITGDLIDRRNTRIDIAIELVQQIQPLAPIYYVSGNHEELSGEYDALKKDLNKLNVQIIDNSYLALQEGGDRIGIMGIADPARNQSEGTYLWEESSEYVRNSIKDLSQDIETEFHILLSHRPEHFSVYKDMNMDLVFSGHAHGGQFRIPFIGGVVAPNQGLFPKYTEGMYHEETTSMVVSRGLGNSIIPLRIFNSPEIISVTLKEK